MSAGDEISFRFRGIKPESGPDADRADDRHGHDFALRQHAVEIVDIDRHHRYMRKLRRQMVETALERLDRPSRAARAFGEEDQAAARRKDGLKRL